MAKHRRTQSHRKKPGKATGRDCRKVNQFGKKKTRKPDQEQKEDQAECYVVVGAYKEYRYTPHTDYVVMTSFSDEPMSASAKDFLNDQYDVSSNTHKIPSDKYERLSDKIQEIEEYSHKVRLRYLGNSTLYTFEREWESSGDGKKSEPFKEFMLVLKQYK